MKRYSIILFSTVMLVALLSGCNSEKVRLSGRMLGCDNRKVTLERVAPMSGIEATDTTMTNEKGDFRFAKIALPNNQPALYNLKTDDQTITLLMCPGEKIHVSSLFGTDRNYIVTGSRESALVKEISDILNQGAATLDSIANARPLENLDEQERREAARVYLTEYYKVKREHIRFIVNNCNSLAAIYALYQRLPNETTLFNGENDIVYYRMVADSVAKNYPHSPYLLALQNAINRVDREQYLWEEVQKSLDNPLSYPDIEMADMYGTKHRLSDLTGKVVLLDFWSANSEVSNMTNAELKKLYEEVAGRGFEIYQISVDDSKPMWVNTVQRQKLPWISVCDFKGTSSSAVLSYNISQIPSNFLINAEGELVGKNLYGEELRKEVLALLKK